MQTKVSHKKTVVLTSTIPDLELLKDKLNQNMQKFKKALATLSLFITMSISNKENNHPSSDCYYTFIVAKYNSTVYISNVFNTCDFIIDKDKGTTISKKLYNNIVQAVVEKFNLHVSNGDSNDLIISLGKSFGFQNYVPYKNYMDAKTDWEGENLRYLNKVNFSF